MRIRKIQAETIVNAQGKKTIEIIVNKKYSASTPLGISIGKNEVLAFPSSGIPISIVNRTLDRALNGLQLEEFSDLEAVEKILFEYDSSPNLAKLGGNVVLALEYALLRAMSNNEVWKFLKTAHGEMPTPIVPCFSGGKHLNDSCDFQEFLLIPHGEKFSDSIMIAQYLYKRIWEELKPVKKSITGGWATTLDPVSLLSFLKNLKEEAFDKFSISTGIGLDVAASHLFEGGSYFYKNGKIARESQIRHINMLSSLYSLEYIEDPLEENDVGGFGFIKGDVICGDDIVCMNMDKLNLLAGKINAITIKPNQIGSIIKTKQLIDWAKKNNIETVMSYRAGETQDTMISDLSVAFNTQYIKTGISGKHNTIKISRLKEIEREIK